MSKYVLLILLFFSTREVLAQDPHFSQFFSSPLTLNPAFTGKFDGTVRVAGNYRNQWPTINRAYQTATLSVDFPILKSLIPETDTWGLGLMGYTDKSANGAVKFNYFTASTAYHKSLDEEGYQQIGVGFQATYANMMINTAELKFEDQLTNSGFTGVTSEAFSGATLKNSYIDVNAGLLYTGSFSDRDNFYGGISMYHINRPRQQFTGALYTLSPRTTFHAGGYFPVGENTYLHLSALTSLQAKATETVFGGAFQIQAGTETMITPISFYAGGWMRMNDALIPYIGLELNNTRIGITYDINTSALKSASSSRGGIEISLIYINKPSDTRNVPCPKF
jgi:type IX secretion system PorP/SprF family membrane protein